jgi:hypothetical protein
MVMRKAGRTVIATLLCGSLAALTASPALAQGRGNSGLPAGTGNPTANLQRQINSLEEQMESLNIQVEVLSSQIGQGSERKLAVYDYYERKVGDIVGVEFNVPWVGVNVDNRTFVMQVTPQQLVGQSLYFSDTICMGPRVYISGFQRNGKVGGAHVLPLAAVHSDGTVYVAEPNTSPLQQPVLSTLDAQGRCLPTGGLTTVMPASPLPTNLRTLFQGPFTVR